MQNIIDKAKTLGTLSSKAEGRLQDFLSISSSYIEDMITAEDFEIYVDNQEDVATALLDYTVLTSVQKKQRNLENAHAYYTLYFMIEGLKQLEVGSIFLDKQQFGEGNLEPSTIEEVQRLKKTFKKNADNLISKYSSTGNNIGILIV